MTIVSGDPSSWWTINYDRQYSYFSVVGSTVVVYDWALTFGQEFELVWMQRWSLMTFLYISVRYIGIPYIVIALLVYLPSVSLTDAVSTILYLLISWIDVIVGAMLSVIIIARLYAMYQRSRQLLIFLIVTSLLIQVTRGIIGALLNIGWASGKEQVLSGAHMCIYAFQGDALQLIEMTWVLATTWEILSLCLAVWVAVKHFRESQGPSSRWNVRDSFTVLVKTHVFYFASFVVASSLQLSNFSPKFFALDSVAKEVFSDIVQFVKLMQMFVLGPRLILGVRDYHANLVANSDEGTGMTSIAFQERVHISTGSGV